jgi:predicted transcriptional regulator
MREVYNSSLEPILIIFSDERNIDLMKIMAKEDHQLLTADFIRKKLNVTRKELNARMGGLMPLGIIDKINDQYELTQQGKEIYESLMMIDDATKIYSRLDAIEILEGRGEEEIAKLMDTIVFSKGLKQLIKQTMTQNRFKPKQR